MIVDFPILSTAGGLVRGPSQATLKLAALSQSSESVFDGSVQTIAMPGARWVATLNWQPMPMAHWRVLSAFLWGLQGRAGRFHFNHPLTIPASPPAVGSPVVNGGGQTGFALLVRGFLPTIQVVSTGDFLSFVDASGRDRLHQVTANAVSGAGGYATLNISPPLRSSPADGASIELAAPKGIWMLSKDDQPDMSQNATAGTRVSTSIEIIEALAGTGISYSGGFVLDSSALG